MDFLEKLASKKIYVIAFLSIITLLVYFPVLKGDYILEDESNIVNNPNVQDLNHVKNLYSNTKDTRFYRPNVSLCHAVVYSLFGKEAAAQHGFSIVVHGLNACLVFIFLALLGFSNISSWVAATMFAVHPINTEAVAYISGLADPLSLLFILMSAIFYVWYRNSKLVYHGIGCFVFVILSLFTKESSVMVFVILIGIEIYLQPKKMVISKQAKVLLGIVAFCCIGFALYVLKSVYPSHEIATETGNEYIQSVWVRFVTFCFTLPKYLGMLVFPLFQYFEKPYQPYVSFQALGFGGLMLLGAFGYIFYVSYTTSRTWMLAIGISFAFLFLVSGIIPNNEIYTEHWLYLPFLGLTIAIATSVENVNPRFKLGVLLGFGVLILVYSVKTMYRNYQWTDAVTFYKNEIKYNKKSARLYNNLAMALFEKEDFYSAINYYGTAISVYDAYPQTHHNLALTYLQLNQISSAIAEEYKALEMQPDFMFSLRSLQGIYIKLKDEKRTENFAGYIKLVEEGKKPEWKDIKENLHADK